MCNLLNYEPIYTGEAGEGCLWHPECELARNFFVLGGGEFSLTPPIAGPLTENIYSVLSVLPRCGPLKIFYSVVRWISVEVVHDGLTLWVRDKSFGYKSVNLLRFIVIFLARRVTPDSVEVFRMAKIGDRVSVPVFLKFQITALQRALDKTTSSYDDAINTSHVSAIGNFVKTLITNNSFPNFHSYLRHLMAATHRKWVVLVHNSIVTPLA